MSEGYTPGPWFAEPMVGEVDTIWIGNSDGYVAQVTRVDGLEPADWADARLIAAAPDMLAALIDGAECLAAWMEIADPEDVREHDERALAAMRAAIARAGGEA